MQLEYVDLVFCHRPDPRTPIEETVRGVCIVYCYLSLALNSLCVQKI